MSKRERERERERGGREIEVEGSNGVGQKNSSDNDMDAVQPDLKMADNSNGENIWIETGLFRSDNLIRFSFKKLKLFCSSAISKITLSHLCSVA